MIRLLISVKNVEEARDAVRAGADFIDLKDPNQGALGSLDNVICQEVVREVNQRAMVSATVGDTHDHKQRLMALIEEKLCLGVDIIKLPLSPFFEDTHFLNELRSLIKTTQIKLIAVMFAEQPIDLSWIKTLAETGFYGVMLDTASKSHHLLATTDAGVIDAFVKQCELYNLEAGLAGALRVEYLDELVKMYPSYLGFRSGVCEGNMRERKLLPHLVKEIKEKLHKHNNFCNKIRH
jgi:uncharacterized protein (UPF0264 family)